MLSKRRQRSDSGNLPVNFLGFIEQIWKENNTYFIDLLIIENVELLNLKGFCGESVLYGGNWTCHFHDV